MTEFDEESKPLTGGYEYQGNVSRADAEFLRAAALAWTDPEPFKYGKHRSDDGDPAGYDFDAVFEYAPRTREQYDREATR